MLFDALQLVREESDAVCIEPYYTICVRYQFVLGRSCIGFMETSVQEDFPQDAAWTCLLLRVYIYWSFGQAANVGCARKQP